MKKLLQFSGLLAFAVLAAACSMTPKTTSLLEQARVDYAAAQNDPSIARRAPVEMRQAAEALHQADVAAGGRTSDEKIDQLAYIAKQKVAVAQEAARRRMAEENIASATRERDQLRLAQRTSEADAAKQAAQQAQARSAQLEAQLADLAAKQTERGTVVTLGDVLFATGRANLNASGMRTVRKLADFLLQNPQRVALIEGFTDSTGSASTNQQLSERRAYAVRDALLNLGVSSTRIQTRGYGEDYPVAPNNTAQNRRLNRRVEIIISDESGKIAPRR